jgi:protein CpxP
MRHKEATPMKNTRWMTMAAVLTLSASLAVAAPRGEGKGGKWHKGGHGQRGEMAERLMQQLDLTAEQKAQVQSLRSAFREQNKATFDKARETFRQFREAKKANDQAAVDALKPQMEAQHTQLKELREAHHAQLLRILTPEQRDRFQSLKAEHKAKRGERREHRQGLRNQSE